MLLSHYYCYFLFCFELSHKIIDNSFLDWFDRSTESAHPVFAKITDNLDLAVQISKVRTRNDNPVTPIQMISVRVS